MDHEHESETKSTPNPLMTHSFACMAGLLLMLLVSIALTSGHLTQGEAVIKGHARWVPRADGSPEFRWNERCVEVSK